MRMRNSIPRELQKVACTREQRARTGLLNGLPERCEPQGRKRVRASPCPASRVCVVAFLLRLRGLIVSHYVQPGSVLLALADRQPQNLVLARTRKPTSFRSPTA